MNTKTKLKNLIYYFRKSWQMARSFLVSTLCRNIFTALISLIGVIGLGVVIDALTSGKSKKEVFTVIIIYLSANLAVTLINQVLILLENNAMRKASNVLQYGYMRDCIDIDYHYVQDRKVLNLKRKSMMAHPAFSLNHVGSSLNYLVQLIGLISIFSLLSPIFIVIVLLISSILIWLTTYTQKCDYDFKNERVEDDRKLKYLYDVMTKYKFAKEIRINNAGEFIDKKYDSAFSAQIKKLKKLLRKKLGVNLLSVLLSCIQAAVMYLYFTYQVVSGNIGIAEYSVMLASTTLFNSALLSLFKSLGMVNNALKAAEVYREYEETLKNNCSIKDSNSLPKVNIDMRRASLKFENVSFCYPGSASDTLKNINLEIKPEKKLGIVGLNGSGKTTLIKLILRLYKPTEGKIMLGGIDIWEIPYSQYSKYLGVVLQDFALFAYSVRENLVFDGEYNEKKLYDSIEKSGLREKTASLPNGIDTSIYRDLDDKGIEFSGGEGQKLAMARAIYRDAAILILDEPSSALDAIAEYELFSRLGETAKGKTTIFISHRLSSTLFCDSIAVIDKGSVIEQGSHTELIEKNGFYAELYHSQSKYYEDKEATA